MTRQELETAKRLQSGLFAVPIVKEMVAELERTWDLLDRIQQFHNDEFKRMTGICPEDWEGEVEAKLRLKREREEIP